MNCDQKPQPSSTLFWSRWSSHLNSQASSRNSWTSIQCDFSSRNKLELCWTLIQHRWTRQDHSCRSSWPPQEPSLGTSNAKSSKHRWIHNASNNSELLGIPTPQLQWQICNHGSSNCVVRESGEDPWQESTKTYSNNVLNTLRSNNNWIRHLQPCSLKTLPPPPLYKANSTQSIQLVLLG